MHNIVSITVAAALLGVMAPAMAGERTASLTVQLKVSGLEQWRNAAGTDTAKVRYTQQVSFTTRLRGDGEAVDFNYKDAGYAAQQMGRASQVALAVTQARGQKPMTQAEFQSRVEKEQAACKGEMSCLMNLASKVTEWSMQMTANGAPTQAPPSQPGSYFNYYGFEDCGAKVHIDLQGTTEGHYQDVQGPVPFAVAFQANHDGGQDEVQTLCTQTNLVVDAGRKTFHGDGWLVTPPQGTTTRTSRGRTTTSEGHIPFREEIIAWANEQLRDAPLSGSRKATVKMRNANGTGIPFVVTQVEGGAEVEMSWRFE